MLGRPQRPNRMHADDRRQLINRVRNIGLIVVAVVAVILAILAVQHGGR